MFTTGSKLLLGATTLTVVAAIVVGITTGGDAGWTATIGLIGAAAALALVAGVNIYARDSNVSAMQAEATTTSAAAQPAPTRTFWPIFAAVGLGLVVVGLVTRPVVFLAGAVVLLAVLVEWMVLAWSERASADRTYNASLRKRILHPLEFPILAAVGVAVIVYSFSRIMLFISKSTGPAIFGVLAALVLFGGVLFAYSPGLKKSITIGLCVIAGLGLVSTGAVMAIDGEREMHAHEIIAADTSICSSNDETDADHNGSQTVGAKSSVAAVVTLEDGALRAETPGIFRFVSEITLPRANPSVILFRNLDEEEVRLVAHLGAFESESNGTVTVQKPVTCTTLVEEGGSQMMTLIIPQSSAATPETDPYRLAVPGIDSSILIHVP